MDDTEQFKEWLTSITVLWTCPKCGNALSSEVITTYPPIYVYRCYKCGWEHERQNKFVFLPFPGGEDLKERENIEKTS